MAIVKPFKAVRPKEEYAKQVAALPYDVYNRQEAKEEVKKEELSFLKIDSRYIRFLCLSESKGNLSADEKRWDFYFRYRAMLLYLSVDDGWQESGGNRSLCQRR